MSPLQPGGFGMIGNRPTPAEIEGSASPSLIEPRKKALI